MTDKARAVADVEPVRLSPSEDFCYCDHEISLQTVSGGAAPEGLYGRVTLKVKGQYIAYAPASALAALQAELTQARDEISTREIELMAQLAESQAEVERLREAAQLALKYGSFEQGSGVIKALQSALQGGKT